MTDKSNIYRLVNAYNESTNPGAFRTEHEHKRNSQRARAARRILTWYHGRKDYVESESGRLYPTLD
jgi:hypothetical protein